jgi:hypothetical protein
MVIFNKKKFNKIKMIKNNIILLILVFAALLLLCLQPFYTWFTADDFCYIQKVQANGLISNMWHEYLNWDGRSISLTYPVCRFGLWVGKYWVGPMIATILLYAIAKLILAISEIKSMSWLESRTREVVLTAVLWLVCFYFSSQTLYWTTGIGYNMDVVMLFSAYLLLQKWQNKAQFYMIGIPVFFYAGTCSPNGVMALIGIVITQWLYEGYVKNNVIHRKYIFALAFILLAFAMVVLSPGNSRRMTGWDWNNLTHFWTVYFNVKQILGHLMDYNSPVLWVLMGIGLVGSLTQLRNSESNNIGKLRKLVIALYTYRFLLAALLSAFFFLPLPGMHSPRTNIQFAMFMVLFAMTNIPGLLNLMSEKLSENTIKNIQIGILAIFIVFAGSQAFDARYVKGQLAARDAKLKNLKGQDVTLTEVDFVRTPTTRHFEDLASDSSYWLNQCVASYYGLKSIKMVDNRTDKTVMGKSTR